MPIRQDGELRRGRTIRILMAGSALAFLLCAGCASVKPVPMSSPREDVVSLRFDWAPGEAAQVEVSRSLQGSEGRDELVLRYGLQVESGGDGGLRVQRKNVKIDAMPTLRDPRLAEMIAKELAQPDWRVNSLGNLVGIDEPTRAQATAASLLGRLAKTGEIPEALRGRLLGLFGDEGLRRRAAGDWDELVGLWAGGDLEVGRVYQLRDRLAIDGLGGIGLEMLYEIVLTGRVPCAAGERPDGCVQLEITASPEPDQRGRLLAFISTIFPFPARAIEIEERVTLVTEASGLRPRRLHARHSLIVPFLAEGEGGAPAPFEQIEERQVSFAWSRPQAD
ncbi:hypothetical protein [Vulgatibacter incomptus]|uniref:Uncharacterized protein n=1 Tax=Vulgatibacter incomptus TaxID=1391653 RepID=A0A0K1P9Q1_9BACT|nr:hypothetical protein [Vulgatibacter incomptus]AKU90240.1 hypothetical protein AKJ08_0627 [Vulgatibacter incomptus]